MPPAIFPVYKSLSDVKKCMDPRIECTFTDVEPRSGSDVSLDILVAAGSLSKTREKAKVRETFLRE